MQVKMRWLCIAVEVTQLKGEVVHSLRLLSSFDYSTTEARPGLRYKRCLKFEEKIFHDTALK